MACILLGIEKPRLVRGSVVAVVDAGGEADRQDAAFEKRPGVGARIEELALRAIVLAVEAQLQVARVDALEQRIDARAQHARADQEHLVRAGHARGVRVGEPGARLAPIMSMLIVRDDLLERHRRGARSGACPRAPAPRRCPR